MENERPVTAHLHSVFFLRSETFIYNLVSNLKDFDAICLAREFENLDAFPFPEKKRFVVRPEDRNIALKLLRKVSGIDGQTESLLKRERVRLLHAHFGPNGFAALPMKKRLHLPLVTTFYGYDASELGQSKEWLKHYAVLFTQGDLFLVEGNCLRSKLIHLGCPETKIRVQKIAIPLHKIPFKPRTARTGRPAVLIFSGRFVEKKGLIPALEALKRLRAKRQDFEFRIVGDGPLKTQIESFVRSNAMQDYVRLLGFLDYRGYLDEMARADIFIQPSVTAANGDDEGGAPTTVLEAQAMGLPVVSTRHADIPNIVVPDKSALLSEEKDADGLSRNIEWLLENGDAWQNMGAAGRIFVETHHDLGVNIGKLENIYRSLTAPSSV